MKVAARLAVPLLLSGVCFAGEQPAPEWTMYGYGEMQGQHVDLFYLSSYMPRLANGHVLVLTKGLDGRRPARARVLYEIDCRAHARRVHRLEFYFDGQKRVSDGTGDWDEQAPPGTNAAALMMLVCPA